jgi:hypothetical protein
MGVVYEAMDQVRNERVALKTLLQSDARLLYRLKSEFRILQNLYHPNLIRPGQLFEEEGNWFFTMEMIDGQELMPFVRGGGEWLLAASQITGDEPTIDAAKGATVDVNSLAPHSSSRPSQIQGECDLERLRMSLEGIVGGLHALHQSGVVHCDVKPGNIMVTNRSRVVLVDFGLAHDLGESSHGGQLLGTPAYMSPEQAAGTEATAASDWYSLGVTMYEALTGRLPFDGNSSKILQQKQDQDPGAPSTINKDIPEDLDSLCLDLLRRQPTDRPTGNELLSRVTQAQQVAIIGRVAALTAQFIGRKRELAMLDSAFEAVKPNKPVVVHVQARSGLGKTALVDHFLGSVLRRADTVVLRGRCSERAAVPFKGVDHLIDSLSCYLNSLARAQVRTLLPSGMAELLKVFPILRQVHGISKRKFGEVSTDPRERRSRAFAALRDLLANIAETKRLVIAIDDMQWSDIDSTMLLSTLERGPRAPGMLLVGTFRSEDAEGPIISALSQSIAADIDLREITLAPLSQEESKELAIALLAATSGSVKTERMMAIAEEVDGSPLLLSEIARHLEDASVSGRLASKLDISLEDVLSRRLDKLPADALGLLRTIATIGRPVDPEFVMRAARITSASDKMQLLASAYMVNLYHGERDTVEVFHQRLREAVMGELPPDQQAEIHQNIAEAITENEDQDPELLLDIAIATGSTKTLPYVLQAAEQAEQCLAFERAAELYTQALKLCEDSEQAELRTKLADVLCLAGHGKEAAEHYLILAEDSEGLAQVELVRHAADNLLWTGHIEEGLKQLGVVLETLGIKLPRSRAGAIASLVTKRARLALKRGRYRATAKTEPDEQTLTKLDSLYAASTSLGMIDHLRGSLLHSQYMLWALRSGDEQRICKALALEVSFLSVQGAKGVKIADTLGREVLLRAERMGDDRLLGGVRLSIGISQFFAGKFTASRSSLEEAMTYLRREAGAWWELNTAQFFHCLAQLNEGDFLSYAPSVQSIINRAARRNDAYMQYLFTGHPSIWCSMRNDDVGPAQEALSTVLQSWPTGINYQAHYSVMAGTSMSLLYEGRAEEVAELIENSTAMLRDLMIHRMPFVQGEVDKFRGRAALLLGDDKTARLMSKKLGGSHLAIARAMGTLLAAPLAAKDGDSDGSQRLLLDAKGLYNECGAKHLALACDYQLGKLVEGKRGDEMSATAITWMQGQGVVSPERMFKFLAPGFE